MKEKARVKHNSPKNQKKGQTKFYRIQHDCEALIHAKQGLALLQQKQPVLIGTTIQTKSIPRHKITGGGKNQWEEVNLDILELNKMILDTQTIQEI